VTQSDIDNGQESHCQLCPVALALKRVLRAGEEFIVHHVNATIRCEGYTMPKRTREFIWSFDERGPVKPFRFRMTLPVVAVLPSVLKKCA
jgi:hypothetical protein